MSKEKSPSAKMPWRIPPKVKDVQVNHCRNPICANFGVPPKETVKRGRPTSPKGKRSPGDYIVSADGVLTCLLCGETFSMQSNLAIVEEVMRIGEYLDPVEEMSCPNEDCEMHGVGISSAVKGYKKYGKTAAGATRYQCLKCRTTFSDRPAISTSRQRITHRNIDVFKMLVEKVCLTSICDITGLNFNTLYRKIAFIHKQCLLFAGERERQLTERNLNTRYLCTDRQKYVLNWRSRKDRRNTQLLAIGTADIETGYVFGLHLNFDADMDAEKVEVDRLRFGDQKLPLPFRRYARVWLEQDYQSALERRAKLPPNGATKPASIPEVDELYEGIAATYRELESRENTEASDDISASKALPKSGMQIHEQCSMYAHIQFVSRLLRRAEKLRFYMDQESGLRGAFMSALAPRILNRTADAFYVSALKEATIDQKRKVALQIKKQFERECAAHPDLSHHEVELLMMRREMARMATLGKWNDRWVTHPLPNMSETAKRVCWLTDLGDYEDDHAARLYLKATLHPIDRFFMQLRRAIYMAERPFGSASNKGRVWHGYSAYQPRNLAMAIEIFRTYYNYCLVGKDGKTPAMRMGLARGPVAPEDILYFANTSQKAADAA